MAWAVFTVNYFACVTYNSQITKVFGDDLYIYVIRTLYLTAPAAFLYGLWRGERVSSFWSFVLFLYLATMTVVGNIGTPHGVATSSFVIYGSLASAPVAGFLFRQGRGDLVEISIKYVALIYLTAYIYLSMTISEGFGTAASSGVIIAAAGARSTRIFLDQAAVASGLFLSLAALRSRGVSVLDIMLLSTSVLSIFLSQSRFLLAALTVVVLLFISTRSMARIGAMLTWFFLTVSAVLLLIMTVGVNSYAYFSSDDTAYVRMVQFDTMLNKVWESPLFGHGFFNPSSDQARQGRIDYSEMLFWNDLGIYGVIFAAGFIGLVVFLAMSLISIRSWTILAAAGLERPFVQGLALSLTSLAILGLSAPALWQHGLELFALLIAAAAVGQGRRSMRLRSKPIRRSAHQQSMTRGVRRGRAKKMPPRV